MLALLFLCCSEPIKSEIFFSMYTHQRYSRLWNYAYSATPTDLFTQIQEADLLIDTKQEAISHASLDLATCRLQARTSTLATVTVL